MNTQITGVLNVAIAGTPDEKSINPTFKKPMYATNKPIPPPIAFCKLMGMERIIIFRALVTVMRILIIPHINTMESACCQVNPSPKQTVYVKNAPVPIPGACA